MKLPLKTLSFLFEEKSGGDGAGGGAGGSSNPSNPPAPTSVVDDDGEETDDLGYPIEKKPGDEQKPADKKESKADLGYGDDEDGDKKPDEKKDAGKNTGYGDDEEKPADEKPEDKKPVDEKKEEKKLDYELDEKGLESQAEAVKNIKDFAAKHGLTKDAAQTLLDDRKAMVARQAEHAKQVEAEKVRVRAQWKAELKSDATFGGENYGHNIKLVDRVIEENLPEIKKKLTDGKTMLPPYIMKDLAAIGRTLYGSKGLVQGDPVSSTDDASDDALSFYE